MHDAFADEKRPWKVRVGCSIVWEEILKIDCAFTLSAYLADKIKGFYDDLLILSRPFFLFHIYKF